MAQYIEPDREKMNDMNKRQYDEYENLMRIREEQAVRNGDEISISMLDDRMDELKNNLRLYGIDVPSPSQIGNAISNEAQDILEGNIEHPGGQLVNAGRVLHNNEKVRNSYNRSVSQIDPNANDLRNYIRDQHRAKTPAELRWMLPERKGPRPGSVGGANRTNPKATEIARRGGKIGRGLGVLGLGLAANDIYSADNRKRAVVANAFSLVGSGLGGAGGAALGAPSGPGAIATGIAGAAAGGHYGYELGEDIYDWYYDRSVLD